jgi:dynein heavy chain
MQPRTAAGAAKVGESPDEIGDRMAKEIEARIPDLLPVKKIDDPSSLDIFRMQEVERFNALISILKRSLSDLQKAIKGTVVMSIQLENMFLAFLDKKVPELWESAAYPSLKPLASWVNDFIERVVFFRQWVDNGTMNTYWTSAFFFPQGFMTAAMQTYARRTHIAIDTLMFTAEIKPYFKDQVTEGPKDGVNVHGLFIEGCRCNMKSGYLEESEPQVLFTEMPVIW